MNRQEKQAKELSTVVEAFAETYCDLDENQTNIRLAEDAWSLREILGHLVDSASNNHQRIVRLLREEQIQFPNYHFSWLETQQYNDMPFDTLLNLWVSLNTLLAHLISITPDEALDHLWDLKEYPLTLRQMIDEYLLHLNHHLGHFKLRLVEIERFASRS